MRKVKNLKLILKPIFFILCDCDLLVEQTKYFFCSKINASTKCVMYLTSGSQFTSCPFLYCELSGVICVTEVTNYDFEYSNYRVLFGVTTAVCHFSPHPPPPPPPSPFCQT